MALPGSLRRTGRGPAGSALFVSGMDSGTDPMFVNDRSYRFATNALCRGGTIRTRPGNESRFLLSESDIPQGCWIYRPISGSDSLVFASGGKVYAAPEDLGSSERIFALNFFSHAPRLFAASCVKSVERNPADGTLSATEPRRVLVIQDGGFTRAGVWDASTAYHSDPTTVSDSSGNVLSAGIPLGGPMAWSGDRLWVAQGNKLFASDIADPTSFVENEYAAEGGFFAFEDDITALAETPGLENPVLLVFTASKTYSIKSYIRDRLAWKSTDLFKSTLFSQIGCVGQNAVVAQNGLLWWMSPQVGLVNFNSAQQARLSSRMSPQDAEMAASKFNLSYDLSGVCLGAHENFLLVSVPSGDKFNRHTWVYDSAVIGAAEQTSGAAWASVWTGTLPVAWAAGPFGPRARCFHLSMTVGGQPAVWESFSDSRQDGGQPIEVSVETKTHLDFSEAATGLDLKKFVFAELTFAGVYGDVSVEVFWAGTRGKYKPLAQFQFVAGTGSVVSSEDVGSGLSTALGQSRRVRTPDASGLSSSCSSCGIESARTDLFDVGFSLLIRWTGDAALRSYRIFSDPEQESGDGASAAQQEEHESGTPVLGTVCR